MITLYGIPNCDTTKKAMSWLKANKIPFTFHDYKQQGISKEKLKEWLKKQPLDTVFNKRSTAWKELSEKEQQQAGTEEGSIKLMLQHNNLIKRPAAEISGTILFGFSEPTYKQAFL